MSVEVDRQVVAFRAAVGRPPTHLDGHQHVQCHEPAWRVLRAVAADLGVRLRCWGPVIACRGEFYGQDAHHEPYPQGITVGSLVAVVASLADGWTEVGCHPGVAVDPATSVYAHERAVEVAALCDPAVRAALDAAGVVLASFATFGARNEAGAGSRGART